jgi:hypothetical protein
VLSLPLDPDEDWAVPPARYAEMWELFGQTYEQHASGPESVPGWSAAMAELCHAVARVLRHLAELTPVRAPHVDDASDSR